MYLVLQRGCDAIGNEDKLLFCPPLNVSSLLTKLNKTQGAAKINQIINKNQYCEVTIELLLGITTLDFLKETLIQIVKFLIILKLYYGK